MTPTWRAKDVMGMTIYGAMQPLCGSAGEIDMHKEQNQWKAQGDLPSFRPLRSIKPYSCFWCIRGVEAQYKERFSWQGVGRAATREVLVFETESESSKLLPWPSFYSSRGYHSGKTVIIE